MGARVWLVALMIGAVLTACGQDSSGPGTTNTPCSELCDAQCAKKAACDESQSDEQKALCLENCAQIEDDEWGTLLRMAPLACAAYEECLDFRFCVLLGGEAGFACGGNPPDDIKAPEYEESCAGLCDYQIACDNQSGWYRQDCISNCEQSLSYEWTNPLIVRCVHALDCGRLNACLSEIYYGNWDNNGTDVDVPPDVAEPEPEPVDGEGDFVNE